MSYGYIIYAFVPMFAFISKVSGILLEVLLTAGTH